MRIHRKLNIVKQYKTALVFDHFILYSEFQKKDVSFFECSYCVHIPDKKGEYTDHENRKGGF